MAVCIANVPALTQTVTEAPLHDISPTFRGSIVSSSNAGRHLLIVSLVESSIKTVASGPGSCRDHGRNDCLQFFALIISGQANRDLSSAGHPSAFEFAQLVTMKRPAPW